MKIAMKCNQEQFDAVKEKLNGTYSMIGDFAKFPYLVTGYYDSEQHISNSIVTSFFKNHILYETWNEQIFLDACGIEKIFKGSELQYKSFIGNHWIGFNPSLEIRIKPNNTAEIEALEKQKLEIDKQIEKLK